MRLTLMIRTLVVALGLTGLIAACATTPPEPVVDYNENFDFSGIKTIAFARGHGGTSGNTASMFLSDMQVNRIDDALSQALELKGFEVIENPQAADAVITWHLVAEQKTDVRTYNTGPSYGAAYGRYGSYNRRSMYSCWNCGTDVRVTNYTQGTFIVDVIDPGLNQSVWRSIIQSKIKPNQENDHETRNAAANRIMAQFPPY